MTSEEKKFATIVDAVLETWDGTVAGSYAKCVAIAEADPQAVKDLHDMAKRIDKILIPSTIQGEET